MSFEFIREGRVWLEYPTNTFYLLHTMKDVTFSQTFQQEGVAKRTLHSLNNLFEGSVINKANPADFSFTLYVVDEVSLYQHKPLDLLLDYNGNSLNTFNLYFVYQNKSPDVYYKIENAVFTSGTFNIPRAGIMTVPLSGQGTKLTRTEGTFNPSIVGYDTTPSFAVSKEFIVSIQGSNLDNIQGASLELQNDISWIKNDTIQDTQNVTGASNTVYPSSFTLEGRSLGGSITQYIDNTNTGSINNLLTWSENASVRIRAGFSAADLQLDINMPNACSFTNRPVFGEVFSQNYDFRLMSNPANLNTYFTY